MPKTKAISFNGLSGGRRLSQLGIYSLLRNVDNFSATKWFILKALKSSAE